MAALKKRSNSMSHRKYFIDCANPQEEFKDFNSIDVKSQHLIVKAIHLSKPRAPKRVAVKLYPFYEAELANQEYTLSEQLQIIHGFMPFVCKVQCTDDLTRYAPPKKHMRLCLAENGTPTTILVSKYMNHTMKNADWRRMGLNKLKSSILQVCAASLHAFTELGFVHGDLHTGNVLLQSTQRTHVRHGDISVECHGIMAYITDFETSKIGKADGEQVFWDLSIFISSIANPDTGYVKHIKGLQKITAYLEPFKERSPNNMWDIWRGLVEVVEAIFIFREAHGS